MKDHAKAMAIFVLDGINHDCEANEIWQKANWLFGAAMFAGRIREFEAQRLLYDVDHGMGQIASQFTTSGEAIRAAQELKARLETIHV